MLSERLGKNKIIACEQCNNQTEWLEIGASSLRIRGLEVESDARLRAVDGGLTVMINLMAALYDQ